MSILKWHYFLWIGSSTSISPFLPVFARTYTIATATSVGILYTILPFVVLFAKPLFCSIADRYNSHKKVLLIFAFITLFGNGLLLSVVFVNFGSFSWYWFCFIVLFSKVSSGVVTSLNDSLVMIDATKRNKTFGSYRIYGTIGCGTIGLFAGFINKNISQIPYLIPGLVLFIIIISTDIFCIWSRLNNEQNSNANDIINNTDELNVMYKNGNENIKNEIVNRNKNKVTKMSIVSFNQLSQLIRGIYEILIKVSKIYCRYGSLFQYTAVVIMSGIFMGVHSAFYFWFIEEIRGKDTWLMGLSLCVRTFISELPFFVFSHRIVKYFGPSISLNISLFVWALRFFVYGYLLEKGTTYWDVLLIEVSHGPTFSLFYCVMTALAQCYADKALKFDQIINNFNLTDNNDSKNINITKETKQLSTHATMQAIMSSCYEGLGLGIGALLGGFVIDSMGVFKIWRYAAFLALGTALCNTYIEIIKGIKKNNFEKYISV